MPGGVEIRVGLAQARQEAIAVGAGGEERAVGQPQRVDAAEPAGFGIGDRDEARHLFLVRHGDVAADQGLRGEAGDEGAKVGGGNGEALIAAGDAVEAQPVIVDQGEREWATGQPITAARGTSRAAVMTGSAARRARYARSGSNGRPRMVK